MGEERKKISKTQQLATRAIDFAEAAFDDEGFEKFKSMAMKLWKKNESNSIRMLDKVKEELINQGKMRLKNKHQVDGYVAMINTAYREILYSD